MMRLLSRGVAAVAVALLAAIGSVAAIAHGGPTKVRDVNLELVGQVINSPPGVTPATSAQFGHVSRVDDLPAAPLTFYTDTTTTQVVNNGPLRVVSRTGRLTVYHDAAANEDFANPDSFRDGTPVLTAVVRQQVILNTLTGSFTAGNENTITSRSAFELGNAKVVLGRVGGHFRTVISGQLASASPPSAYMAGYTFSTGAPVR
jgi:hypothetical protein